MSVNLKQKQITQENFPGSILEPEWSRADLIEKAPFYALRLTCNAQVQMRPRGNKNYVSLMFDGMEYILHENNFASVQSLQEDFVTSFLRHKGYVTSGPILELMRYQPNLLIEALQFLITRSRKTFEIPAGLTRVYWPLQDDSACTYYRSAMPFAYMQTKADEYYTEASRFFSHNSLSYFDAIWVNRAPSANVMAIVESIRRDGKVLIYEADDNLFDIPAWNPAHKWYTEDIKRQIKETMATADFCVGTNEYLATLLGKQAGDKESMVGPNLLDMNEYEVNVAGRQLSERWTGYHLRMNESNTPEFVKGDDVVHSGEMNEVNYDPIRILWSGSPTHELDLEQIVEPVKYIGRKYGIAVRFLFQNFLPPQFASAYAQQGSSVPQMAVAEEYEGFITFVPGVKTEAYQRILKTIKPDFALCPLTDHAFNLAKSEIKPLEMAAIGIPSIVSDYGPYQFIENGYNGLKVKVNDTQGWIDCLTALIEDRSYRLKLGEAARKTVEEEWSWQYDSINRRKWDAIFARIQTLVESRKEKIRSRAAATYVITNNEVEQARYEQIREEKVVGSDR